MDPLHPTIPTSPEPRKKFRPRGRPVDLMAALATFGPGKKVQVARDLLYFSTDRRQFELILAQAVRDQILANIAAGKNPSGRKQKPLKESTVDERGPGPRGLGKTGKFVSSIQVVEHTDYVGVQAGLEAKGQLWRIFRGARWTYNPKDLLIRKALSDIVDALVFRGEKI